MSTPYNRHLYDKEGEQAIRFNIMPFSKNRHKPIQAADVVYEEYVPINDLNNGCIRKISVRTKILCDTCQCQEGETTVMYDCPSCSGKGIHLNNSMIIRMLRKMPISNICSTCTNCHGMGKLPKIFKDCPDCHGMKVSHCLLCSYFPHFSFYDHSTILNKRNSV